MAIRSLSLPVFWKFGVHSSALVSEVNEALSGFDIRPKFFNSLKNVKKHGWVECRISREFCVSDPRAPESVWILFIVVTECGVLIRVVGPWAALW